MNNNNNKNKTREPNEGDEISYNDTTLYCHTAITFV